MIEDVSRNLRDGLQSEHLTVAGSTNLGYSQMFINVAVVYPQVEI